MLRTTDGFHRTVQAGLAGLAWALLLGNPVVLYGGILVFVLLAVELAVAQPDVDLEVEVSDERVARGTDVRIRVRGRIGGGLGRLRVHVPLPDEVELVDGTNYRVLPLRPGTRTIDWTLTIRPRRRGEHTIGPVETEALSLLGTVANDATTGEATELTVQPEQHAIKRLREIKTVGRLPYPEQSVAPVGVATGDFEDIREYQRGDPKKWINWRATAKHLSRGGDRPLVNEFEIEGKHTVWLFIDASSYMGVGTNIENVFEHVVEAAVGITSYYLAKGYKVGLTVHPQMKLVHPDVGRRQTHRVITELTRVGLDEDGDDGLPEAVESTRRFVVTERPICFILTRPESDPEAVETAVKRLRGMIGRRAAIVLVSIDWSGLHPSEGPGEALLDRIAGLRARREREGIRSGGAFHVVWDPTEQDFGSFLSKTITQVVRTR